MPRPSLCSPTLALLLLALPAPALAAGDVSVGVKGGTVRIQGDGEANDFDVKYGTDAMGNDVLVIEGKNGTTVGGQPKAEIPLPAGGADGTRVTEIEVEPAGGDDTVTVDLSGLPQGKRLDSLSVEDEDANSGNDNVTIKNVQLNPGGKMKSRTGPGDDTTSVEGCDTAKLNIVDTEGANTTNVKDTNVSGQFRIQHGEGRNRVRVEDSFYPRGLKLETKGPRDVEPSLDAQIERSSGGKVSFDGTAGHDLVVLDMVDFDSFRLRAGDGDDQFVARNTSFGAGSADGGAGDDCFDEMLDNNDFGERFRMRGFESSTCAALEFQRAAGDGNPAVDPPVGAVAWRTRNPATGHIDGPFAIPGQPNPAGLPVLDPEVLDPPAFWGVGMECLDGALEVYHVHEEWLEHGDPDDDACGHGWLEWGFEVL
jgi:hypothetical protein